MALPFGAGLYIGAPYRHRADRPICPQIILRYSAPN
nr:MAG TPA: Prohormone convertase enzyme [Caudoviricetes sp.]